MPKVKRYLPSSSLGIYVKGKYLGIYLKRCLFTQVFTFGGIYLFTNKVITHFGSNFLKIS